MSYLCFFVFFKQKTAYEMRISDWSSDVCSSDLERVFGEKLALLLQLEDFSEELAEGTEFTRQLRHLFETRRIGGALHRLVDGVLQIGRASCRERVCQYV